MLGVRTKAGVEDDADLRPDVRRVQPANTATEADLATGAEGSPQKPRESLPTPGPASLPSQSGGAAAGQAGLSRVMPGGMAQAAPTRPDAPTPVASQSPAPFQPMVSGMQPTMGRMLFGKAGGLLGGGIGVPGALGGAESPDAEALATLLKYLGGQE